MFSILISASVPIWNRFKSDFKLSMVLVSANVFQFAGSVLALVRIWFEFGLYYFVPIVIWLGLDFSWFY